MERRAHEAVEYYTVQERQRVVVAGKLRVYRPRQRVRYAEALAVGLVPAVAATPAPPPRSTRPRPRAVAARG